MLFSLNTYSSRYKEGSQTPFISFWKRTFKTWAFTLFHSGWRWSTSDANKSNESANTDTEMKHSLLKMHMNRRSVSFALRPSSSPLLSEYSHIYLHLSYFREGTTCQWDHLWYLRSFILFFFSISYNNTDVTEYIVLQTQSTPPPWLLLPWTGKVGGGVLLLRLPV